MTLLVPSRRFVRVVERNVTVYRRTWLVLFTGFFEPVFYLLSIGIGIGELVGEVSVGGRSVDYRTFVAPGLLATSAMNGTFYDSTMNMYYKLTWAKIYDAVLATPVGVLDLALGEMGWSVLRATMYGAGFLGVMAGFGLVDSMWAIVALPGATLIGFTFAAVGMAATSYMRSWNDLDLVTVPLIVQFLFSATFFPLDTYPRAVQFLVQATPLYHGVALERAFISGDVGWSLLVHAAYLLALGALGATIASRRLGQLLTP
ncbi:ABC transporter permease [Candidatus Poriferisocius sp.]|uniref:ABC transporter permease n=1 Tax=Candidatus Poriferisocius sp. TaxID=3101276 RepID=UPI003B5B08F5